MRLLLAPMEGLLDYYLREIITSVGGIDFCVSEFIRVNNTLLPSRRFYRTVPELRNGCMTTSGVPVRVQILGSDPICMAENAAKVASLGAVGIDINFGCPAPTVNRNRGGAALLKEPQLMYEIVRAVRAAVPKSISVTAKMRLGYETPDTAVLCAEALSGGGAEEIVVHARTKVDGYKPPAYWEWIAKIKQSVRIPVIANGEIWSHEDALRCQEISGCIDLMLGRGMISNPALALMIRGERNHSLSWHEVIRLLEKFYALMKENRTINNPEGRMKQWLNYLRREYIEADQNFNLLKKLTDDQEIMKQLLNSSTVPDLITK
ncbi:tRNA dihydrouridine(16) synthase DusC [Leptospira ognonensis]|uniref:tRNA-dihydrouridine synthase n=1 Tax=Leptospira ognonensis TaxID=2484945 RepID=A0A4R9K748_9LEPT|nr:tRNA-dihydrouridine synthase [Leptospira ognonensis]TGL62115.1 tRNA dihydrouridine(16) synthase DusC [Leptospira ognonensis]